LAGAWQAERRRPAPVAAEARRKLRREVLFGLHAAEDFIVDEHDPLEHAVLAHEVFGWGDLFVAFVVLVGVGGGGLVATLGGASAQEEGRGDDARSGDGGAVNEVSTCR
jgi:hypothetical protein